MAAYNGDAATAEIKAYLKKITFDRPGIFTEVDTVAYNLLPHSPSGPSGPSTPSSNEFTTGTDILSTTDGSHVYAAVLGGAQSTLTANDSLQGNGNTLTITDTSGPSSQDVLPAGVSLTGLSTITLTTTGNAGIGSGSRLDLSAVTGLTSFTLTSSGTHGDFVSVGSGVTLTIDSQSSTIDVSSTGTASLSLTAANLTTLQLSGDVSIGTSGTPFAIAHSGATVAGATDNAEIHLTVGITGLAGTAGVSVGRFGDVGGNGATSSSGTVTLGDGNNTVSINNIGGAGGVGGAGENTLMNGDDVQGGGGGSGGNGGHGTITLGDGNNTITDNSAGGRGGNGGAANITNLGASGAAASGDGGNGGDGGHNTITVGNGNNTITDHSTGGSAGIAGTAINGGSGIAFSGSSGTAGTGGGNVITLGTGVNTVDLGSHGNDTIIVGPDGRYDADHITANLVIRNSVAGVDIKFSTNTSGNETVFKDTTSGLTVAALIQRLEADIQGNLGGTGSGANLVAWGVATDNNTYIVSSSTTTLDSAHTSIVKIVGTYTGIHEDAGHTGVILG